MNFSSPEHGAQQTLSLGLLGHELVAGPPHGIEECGFSGRGVVTDDLHTSGNQDN